MKSKLLQLRKVLLVAAGLLVGASAWAEEITNLKLIFNGTTSGNLTYVLGDGEIADGNPQGQYWSPGVAVDTENQRLKFGNANLTAKLVSVDDIKEKDIVTIEFDLALGYSTKGADRDFSFVLYNTVGGEIVKEVFNARTASRRSSTIGFTANDVYYPGNANTDWSNKTHFEIVLNYATGEITGMTTSETATNKTATYTIQMNDAQKVAIGSIKLETGDMGTIDHANLLANLTVTTTVGDYSSTKTITYKYEDEGGTDITEVALAAGATASATPDNGTEYTPVCLQEFTDSEFAYDYKYVSGGESFTVTEDKEITLVYAKTAHPTTNVKVQYTYENEILKEALIAENYPIGKGLTYWVNRYVLKDGVLYETQQLTDYYQRAINVTQETLKETLTKTDLENVVFFAEGEDVFTKGTGSSAGTRCSMGAGGYANNKTEFVTLPAGTYKLVLTNRCSGGKTGVHKFYKGDDSDPFFSADGFGYNQGWSSNAFTLDTETTLYMQGGDNNNYVDWLYIYECNEIPATIGATGYTTFASTVALDLDELPEGVTAYYASDSDDASVTLTPATGQVAAGTGLILAGKASETYNIPVATSGTDISDDNLLVGCTKETKLEKGANQYVLVNNGGIAKFQSLATNGATIPAGKAYLQTKTNGARLSIVFGGETTGINEAVVNGAQQTVGTYNLNGQRVAQPTKGLYIVNGKKVIIK